MRSLLDPSYYASRNDLLEVQAKSFSAYVYNQETLGFRLDSNREREVFRGHALPGRQKVDDFFTFVWSLLETILESQQNQHLHADDWHRTVYIDTLGIAATQFTLTEAEKDSLIRSGREGTQTYFDWYDTSDTARNRPSQ